MEIKILIFAVDVKALFTCCTSTCVI